MRTSVSKRRTAVVVDPGPSRGRGGVAFGLACLVLFAVTFGLLGVINMAHGEMLMLGAYSTYAVQTFFQAHAAGAFRFTAPAPGTSAPEPAATAAAETAHAGVLPTSIWSGGWSA